MQVLELKKKKINSRPKAEVEEMIKKRKKEDEKLIKGKFEFLDAQGGWLDFTYRFWPGDPLLTFHFVHDEICEIPLGLVRHLNNRIKKVRKMNPEIAESGPIRGVPQTYEKTSRIRFTPMEYL